MFYDTDLHSYRSERWILARQANLLPCSYFHFVFTLPKELNWFYFRHPSELYNCIFHSSKETILALGKDTKLFGAQTGIIAVLHTWGQNLSLHPYVHLIVQGGGITKAGHWRHARSNSNFYYQKKMKLPAEALL